MADQPTRCDWSAVRRDYASGIAVKELARRYGVSDRVIRKHRAADEAKGDPWPVPPASQRVEPADPAERGNVVQFPGGRGRGEGATFVLDPTAIDVSDEDLAKALRGAAKTMLDNFNGGRVIPGQHQSMADVFNAVVAGAAKAIDKSRDVAGKKSGQASVEALDASKPHTLRFVVAPKPESVAS